MNSLRMIFSSLCVKLFKLISTEVKKVLNGPCNRKSLQTCCRITTRTGAILILFCVPAQNDSRLRSNDERVHAATLQINKLSEHLHDFEG